MHSQKWIADFTYIWAAKIRLVNAIVGANSMSPGATLKIGPTLAPKFSGCQRMAAKGNMVPGTESRRRNIALISKS
jgi:hypothetical protein